MDERRAADVITEALTGAGITIGGDAPWDVKITDDRLYQRVLRDGTLGVGESFVDGWWDCDALDQMIDKVVRANLPSTLGKSWVLVAQTVRAQAVQPPGGARVRGRRASLRRRQRPVRAMLGPRMMYTCAYFHGAGAANLDAAQDAKLDLVCRKIGARPGMRVLELGCGWAGFASFAAEHYGAKVVGYTVSREQVAWAKQHYGHLDIDIRHDDYRNATGTYDAVVSIGLMEHVGPKNHRAYLEQAVRCLAPGGIVFIHTIGGTDAKVSIDPWFEKYIFPNAAIPSLGPADDGDGRGRRARGRAEHRPALRQDADGVVAELRSRLAVAARKVRRSLLPRVEVLPAGERRVFPSPAPQPVSGRRDAPRCAAPDDRPLHVALLL